MREALTIRIQNLINQRTGGTITSVQLIEFKKENNVCVFPTLMQITFD